MANQERQDLIVGTVVGAVGNGVFYAVAAAVYLLTAGQATLQGLIFSWIGGFCAAALLVGLPFMLVRRNRGSAVGWIFGFALVQACAICGGIGLGLSGYLTLPG